MTTVDPATAYSAAKSAGFNTAQAIIMSAIAGAESTYRTHVTHSNSNGSTDYGLWQINSANRAIVGDAFYQNNTWQDPVANARAAKAIYDRQGFGAWSVYKANTYAKFLPAAQKASTQPVVVLTGSSTPSSTGTAGQAAAQAWWKTIAPGGKIPEAWKTPGSHLVKSDDKVYMFAGHTNDDGSGYGNISWNEGVKSQQLYVRWGADGITAGGGESSDPTPVDPGEVTPVTPFGDLSNLFAGLSSIFWMIGGITAVALGILLLAKDTGAVKMAVAGLTKGAVKL